MMFCSTFVSVQVSPMGVQPCEVTPDQPHLAADGNGHPAFVKNLAVQIHLGRLLAEIAAGQPAEHRQRRISFVPGLEPRFAVQVERVNEGQPAVGLAGLDAGFQMPVAGAVGFLDLLLRKVNRLQLGARQRIQAEGQARVLLHLVLARRSGSDSNTRPAAESAHARGEFPAPASRGQRIAAT